MSSIVLALDFGGTWLRAAAVRSDSSLVGKGAVRSPLEGGPAAVLEVSVELLKAAEQALSEKERADIVGVGISAPGPLDPTAGILVDPPNLGPRFHGWGIAEALGRELGRTTLLERDTHVAALAEGAFGAARGLRHYLYLTVSTGIGGAVVTDGRLMGGPDGVAGELGHLLVDIDGPRCGCGARGHLEAISSGLGIAHAARELVDRGEAPGLAVREAALAPGRLEAVDVAAAEEAGEPAAAAVMERARAGFAAVSVGLVDVFNPERIVVGGSVARHQGDRWLEPARRAVAEHAFRVAAERVAIVPALLGDDVGLAGAVPLLELRLADSASRPRPSSRRVS